MRYTTKVLFLTLATSMLYPAFAQQKKGDKTKKETKLPSRVPVTFGGTLADSSITKKRLLELSGKPLSVALPGARVDHFYFSMTQRNLYEDSVGNLIILAEPFTELCMGDTIPQYLRENLAIHGKPGDTAWVEAIKIRTAEGKILDGRTMKLTLIKD